MAKARMERRTPPRPHKPRCPVHKSEMIFDGLRSVWQCQEEGCRMVAHPEMDVGGKRPFGFSGEFELVIVRDPEGGEDDRYVIRKDKLFFDITEHVTAYRPSGGPNGGDSLKLDFGQVTRIHKDGTPW